MVDLALSVSLSFGGSPHRLLYLSHRGNLLTFSLAVCTMLDVAVRLNYFCIRGMRASRLCTFRSRGMFVWHVFHRFHAVFTFQCQAQRAIDSFCFV